MMAGSHGLVLANRPWVLLRNLPSEGKQRSFLKADEVAIFRGPTALRHS